MSAPKDVEATIYFLTAEEGGRTTSAFTGYRPQFYYNGQDWITSLTYPDVKAANPGETVRAFLGFLSPHMHVDQIHVGMKFLIREGLRTVAKGVITNIIELEQSAKAYEQ